MKLAITLIVLGSLGIIQYVYFQFTPLAFDYSYEVMPHPEYGKFGVNTIEVTMTRDWTSGIVGAIAGVILLPLGIWRFRRQRQKYA